MDRGRVLLGGVRNTISFANLDDSGGGNLTTAGATVNEPSFPVLLQAPSGAGAPLISGGTKPGSTLSCSQGAWAPDALESFDYLAPQSFSYAWSENGAPITGAASSQITAGSPGSYSCQVTASNYAGSTVQSSAAFTVSPLPLPPLQVTKATVDDQQITLTTPSPSVCTASTGKLAATFSSTKIVKSKARHLKFSKVEFYVDKGVKHTRHKLERTQHPGA
jgi:hypothetical protein